MHNLSIRSELDYLFYGAQLCAEQKPGNDGIKQVAPFFASIPYHPKSIERLNELIDCLEVKFPQLVNHGRRRAAKAFETIRGTTTKPSYSGRIHGTDGHDLNQIDALVNIFRKEPYSGGLVFSVFMPVDLVKRRRPGYVPCLVSGSFLVENDEVQLNVFFRSQSVLEFGVFDLRFLREFQNNVTDRFNSVRAIRVPELKPGSLNISAGRIFIHRRLVKIGNHQFQKRDEILGTWFKEMQEFKMTQM